MVVANAVAALAEVGAGGGPGGPGPLDGADVAKLLRALNECTEWGQVFILDALAASPPADPAAADAVAERVAPRLQHANAAVALSAVKVLLLCARVMPDGAPRDALLAKVAPPLVTLLAADPELQYVALRNVQLVAALHPACLAHEVRAFFVKYNDPPYVKAEKLDAMVALANDASVDAVLAELREYAAEVDVDFARRAVRAVGALAVRVEPAAERCVATLLDLVRGRAPHVVQEAVPVVRDVFRRYPGRYEGVIADLCASLDTLDEPAARGAMAWIVGEYADRIDNAGDLLEAFLDGFPDEPASVQLALVTAAVKLFLKKPGPTSQRLIQLVLTYATTEADNPDLRDRAFVYWRLLSSDPEAARDVVLADKPTIAAAASTVDPDLAASLVAHMASLASVYHKPPEAFVSRARAPVRLRAFSARSRRCPRRRPPRWRAAACHCSTGWRCPRPSGNCPLRSRGSSRPSRSTCPAGFARPRARQRRRACPAGRGT
jgi:AP-1 complex subunit beta-1